MTPHAPRPAPRAITRIFRVSIALAKKPYSSFNLRNHNFVVWPFQAGNEKTPLCFKRIYIKHRGGVVQGIPEKVFSCQGRGANPQ